MLEFDPVLLTGVDDIDRQHRELFGRVDRLLAASRERRSKDEVLSLLEYLGSYVVEHFASEDRTMVASAYPRIEGHRQEHRQFVRELDALRRERGSEGPSVLLAIHVGTRVTEWLREHIYRTDRLLGAWLRERGGAS